MKAICVHEIGGPDVLRFEEMPNPQPVPGQVLIRQRAVAVNFIDTIFVRVCTRPLRFHSFRVRRAQEKSLRSAKV